MSRIRHLTFVGLVIVVLLLLAITTACVWGAFIRVVGLSGGNAALCVLCSYQGRRGTHELQSLRIATPGACAASRRRSRVWSSVSSVRSGAGLPLGLEQRTAVGSDGGSD
jgi:hypothetical protein